MNIKASGRSALIVATGLWVCLWGPLQATESTAAAASETARTSAAIESRQAATAALKKVARHRSRHLKRYVSVRRHKSVAVDEKPKLEARTMVKTDAKVEAKADRVETANAGDYSALPPAVANANAQLAAADLAATDGPAVKGDRVRTAAKPGEAQNQQPAAQPADAEIVASDQLNDLDLAVTVDRPKPVAAKVTDVSAASSSDDAWSQTSLIGKIFIAFGGLLTLASAARMFMA